MSMDTAESAQLATDSFSMQDDSAAEADAFPEAAEEGASNHSEDDENGRPENPRPKKRLRTFGEVAHQSPKALPLVDSPEHRHNVQQSRLHQLPVELILEIGDYLSEDEAAVLSMRLVSRDFYHVFEVPFIIGAVARYVFKNSLRRDDGNWFSKWERRVGLKTLRKAFCSACTTRHPKKRFTSEELAKDARYRVCIGTQETVQMHEGRETSLNDIYDLFPDDLQAGFHKVYISKSCVEGPVQPSTGSFLETIIAVLGFPRRLAVTLHFNLSTLPKATELNGEIAGKRLSAVQHLLCPHLQATLEGGNRLPRRFNHLFEDTLGRYDSSGYGWTACLCLDGRRFCDSFFSLHRRDCRSRDNEDEVVMTVYRMYWAPEDNADPAWAKKFVQSLVDEQSALVGTMDGIKWTRLWQAKARGEWEWDEEGVDEDKSAC